MQASITSLDCATLRAGPYPPSRRLLEVLTPHTTTAGLCLPAETGRRRLRVYLLQNLGGYPTFGNRELYKLSVCFEA
jgi:hypothetical protein